MGLSEQKNEGDPITVGEWKEVQDGIAKINEIQENSLTKEDSAVEETFVIELVKGAAFWNQRKCEIAMDSHTFHRIVQQAGEKDARNCLLPMSSSAYAFKPESEGETFTKTIDGLELSNPYYPTTTASLPCKIAHGTFADGTPATVGFDFYFLTSNKDHTENWYFSRCAQKFVNAYQFDQYTPGKIVYVHPTKTANVITPTETVNSFPCVIKTGPQCASWHYNTAYYSISSEDTKKQRLEELKKTISNGDAQVESRIDAALKAYKTSSKEDHDEKLQEGWKAFLAGQTTDMTDAAALTALTQYLEATDETFEEQFVRFDNRVELLVAIARGSLEKYLGFQFKVERTKGDDGNATATSWAEYSGVSGLKNKITSTYAHVQYEDKGYGLPDNTTTWLASVDKNIYEFMSEKGKPWAYLHNEFYIDQAVGIILDAANIICWWLRQAYDGDGKRIPCNLSGASTVVNNEENKTEASPQEILEFFVNRTYALAQSTALLLTVTKMVPGKKYEAFIDPAVTKLAAKYDPYDPSVLTSDEITKLKTAAENQVVQDYLTFSGKGPMVWDGKRFVPYSEPSKESQEETEKIVNDYNKAQEWVKQILEQESEAKAEFEFAPDAVMSIPKTSKPAFTIVDKAPSSGQARTGVASSNPNFVASVLRKEVFGGATPRFGIIVAPISGIKKSSSNPWKTDFEDVSLSFLEVSPKLPQQLWTRLLYCCQDRTTEVSPRKVYGLFGGRDYVPPKAVHYFSEYLGTLNEARKYSRFIIYDGVLNTKTGQFWCSDTGEIYSHWYNINTNSKAKGPCRSDAEGVNVLYTHRMDHALFGSSLSVTQHTSDDGSLLGYVLSTQPGLLFGTNSESGTVDKITEPSPSRPAASEGIEKYPAPVTAADVTPVLKEAPFVPPSEDPPQDITDPALNPENESVTFVWDIPPSETTTVVTESAPATTGIVRLPIVSLPLRDKTVPPRINGPLNGNGETIFDGVEYPTAEKMASIGYSFLVAKCCGLIEPSDTTPEYQEATYPALKNEYRPFWLEMNIDGTFDDQTTATGGGSTGADNDTDTGSSGENSETSMLEAGISPNADMATFYGTAAYMYRTLVGEKLQAAIKSNGAYQVEIKKQFLIGTRMIFAGIYVPKDLKADDKKAIYLNLRTKKQRMYVQKVCEKGANYDKTAGSSSCSWGDESYPSFHSFAYLPLTGDDENDELVKAASNTTAGWVEYAYYDELIDKPEAERFDVLCPDYSKYGVTEVKVKGDEWVFYGTDESGKSIQFAKINPIYLTPFATMYSRSASFGSASVVEITKSKAIIAYTPSMDRRGNNNGVSYNQIWSFPFYVDEFPSPSLPMLTTTTYKAQRKDYVPAICPHLDQNEVILPGTIVEMSERTIKLYPDKNDRETYVDFKYYICEPPESYSATAEGTPYTQILRFKREDPAPADLEDRVIESDDLWITSIVRVSKLPTCEVGGTEYYVGLSLTADGTPRIRQPYGVFNDCDNAAHLGLFIKRSVRGLSYPTTFHIDYVPYGYAVPAKTPACYYKTSGDNCAANIISPQYIIKRVAKGGLSDNFTLQLTGACYVPGSSLTILG